MPYVPPVFHSLSRPSRPILLLPAVLLALGATLTLAPAAHAQADASAAQARPAPRYTGNYIVRWRDGSQTVDSQADTSRMKRVASNTGLTLSVRRPMGGGSQLLTVKDARGESPELVARRLRNDPRVADAVPDRWLQLHDTTPNDPEFAVNQPYLGTPASLTGAANLTRAWDRSRGSSSIVVAVVDTGILAHPDLAGRLVPGYDFISTTTVSVDGDGRDSDPTDPGDYVPTGETCPGGGDPDRTSTWHGTRVAGVLGAATNNSLGIAGVDWSARIQPVRVSGRCGALLSDTVDAMRWAGGLNVPGVPNNPTPAKVINISLGGGSCKDSPEQKAVDDLNAAGVVVVAAAGNQGSAVESPADCSGVIAVTAHANDGENASYANVGKEIAISAPGGGCGTSKVVESGGITTCASRGPLGITTLSNDGAASPGAYTISRNSAGTSFAAPMVSGVAAMMLAVNPSLTPAQVTAVLKASARAHPANTYCTASVNAGKCGAGLLDADAALALAPTPPATGSNAAPPPATAGDSGGGGGAFAPWSAAVLLLVGIAGFVTRRRG
ncbi:MprA protease, GlyGly-CTERM protein-sorting domain-containing form [Cupriavidus agavae]|uniref:Peptidase MprA n=1 Tax=Cupriavidus agavae TaxID=1001822 RepID=A0A4Q7S839_9BURK|nr:MprA protease, GlyGly-CTERM protein-sorting domain-containing form [Cupriavidus agavae]RZT42611.1 peptidase MprA [Cupriavidus agavae]